MWVAYILYVAYVLYVPSQPIIAHDKKIAGTTQKSSLV
jgi:hypothetical protein